jgi:hypothetical protein
VRRTCSARQTRWIVLRPLEDLDDGERAYRAAMCQERATMATAQVLVDQLRQMVCTRARWVGCLIDSGKRVWHR